jgi:hypothetical protein
MSEKLKIYACSGIGNAEYSNTPIAYWTDNTNTISNTQAINTLLARINLLNISISRLQGITPEEKIACLNEIDMLCVCLDAAKRFKDDNEGLEYAGGVIYKMMSDDMFAFDNLNTDERDAHLDELIAYANEQYNDRAPIANINPEFMQWWNESVVSRNKVGLNFGQQQNARKALKKAVEIIKGIGTVDWSQYGDPNWLNNADLAEMLTKGAEYFLYTYFTQAQLNKLPYIFKLKQKQQMRTYNYCKSMFVDIYGSEEEMQLIIRAGIVDVMGEEPEDICDGIASGKTKSIGIATEALVTIITAVIAAVVSIITAICNCIKETNMAKYGALDKEVIQESVPNADDFEGIEFNGTSGGGSSKLLTIAAIGAGLLLLLKK